MKKHACVTLTHGAVHTTQSNYTVPYRSTNCVCCVYREWTWHPLSEGGGLGLIAVCCVVNRYLSHGECRVEIPPSENTVIALKVNGQWWRSNVTQIYLLLSFTITHIPVTLHQCLLLGQIDRKKDRQTDRQADTRTIRSWCDVSKTPSVFSCKILITSSRPQQWNVFNKLPDIHVRCFPINV